LQTYRLVPHPGRRPERIRHVDASIVGIDSEWLRLRWQIEGVELLEIPPLAGGDRVDGLWQTTCFEVFLRPVGGQAYVELNLSPSESWAAYDFTAYREGMAERPIARAPDCAMKLGQHLAVFEAAIPIADLPPMPCELGLCAVLEEDGWPLTYWALAHPEGKPDFHHPTCFAATLPPPGV
jgi:hypothetical protein